MKHLIIAPSILSLDYSNVNEGLAHLRNSKAEWMHFDVMDGNFVPNLTFGPDLLKGFKKSCPLKMDVHLMVNDPVYYSKVFIKNGADIVTFHTEALGNDLNKIHDLIVSIHEQGAMAGISVKPKTPIQPFGPLLKDVDLVLIMSVEPGFGGQTFMEDQLDKVRWLDAERKEHGYSFKIEIDGGINDKTFRKAIDAGVDILVAGSYVFKNPIEETIAGMLE